MVSDHRGGFVEHLSDSIHTDDYYVFGSHLKLELSMKFVQQTGLRGRFVEQNLMLSCSFRRDQIRNSHRYKFGHTVVLLKSDLVVC